MACADPRPRHHPGRRRRRPDGRAHPGAGQAGAAVRRRLPAGRLPAVEPRAQRHQRRVALAAVPGLDAPGAGRQRPPVGPRPQPRRAAAADAAGGHRLHGRGGLRPGQRRRAVPAARPDPRRRARRRAGDERRPRLPARLPATSSTPTATRAPSARSSPTERAGRRGRRPRRRRGRRRRPGHRRSPTSRTSRRRARSRPRSSSTTPRSWSRCSRSCTASSAADERRGRHRARRLRRPPAAAARRARPHGRARARRATGATSASRTTTCAPTTTCSPTTRPLRRPGLADPDPAAAARPARVARRRPRSRTACSARAARVAGAVRRSVLGPGRGRRGGCRGRTTAWSSPTAVVRAGARVHWSVVDTDCVIGAGRAVGDPEADGTGRPGRGDAGRRSGSVVGRGVRLGAGAAVGARHHGLATSRPAGDAAAGGRRRLALAGSCAMSEGYGSLVRAAGQNRGGRPCRARRLLRWAGSSQWVERPRSWRSSSSTCWCTASTPGHHALARRPADPGVRASRTPSAWASATAAAALGVPRPAAGPGRRRAARVRGHQPASRC